MAHKPDPVENMPVNWDTPFLERIRERYGTEGLTVDTVHQNGNKWTVTLKREGSVIMGLGGISSRPLFVSWDWLKPA